MLGLFPFCPDLSKFGYVTKDHRKCLEHIQHQKNQGKNDRVPTFSMLKFLNGLMSYVKKFLYIVCLAFCSHVLEMRNLQEKFTFYTRLQVK